ncbi:IS3 family transposase [Paenibacillus larvae]|nr:IS3 family transposase [Paenibacillus larvae]MDT2194532.1 IS3 family transposase [Paenibacillus larvae]
MAHFGIIRGMMKSEMYYLRKFYTYEELEATVIEYIDTLILVDTQKDLIV